MLNKRILKNTIFVAIVTICVGSQMSKSDAGYTRNVDDVTASVLNVSINASKITQLSRGRDVVGPSDGSSQVWKIESGVNRLWRSYAYPSSIYGKYTNSARGWMCVRDMSDNNGSDTYIEGATRAKFINAGYLYTNSALSAHTGIKYASGTTFGSGNYGNRLEHHPSNLNAWSVMGGSNYMNGWNANAYK